MKYKIGDRVGPLDGSGSWSGTVVTARYESHMGEDQATVTVRTDKGQERVFYEDHLRNIYLIERPVNDFEDQVRTTLDEICDLLIEKNKAYGNNALDPVRVFSKSDSVEQLKVRIDDKLGRLQNGHEYPGDDTVTDLLGYLVLLKIALNDAEAR